MQLVVFLGCWSVEASVCAVGGVVRCYGWGSDVMDCCLLVGWGRLGFIRLNIVGLCAVE